MADDFSNDDATRTIRRTRSTTTREDDDRTRLIRRSSDKSRAFRRSNEDETRMVKRSSDSKPELPVGWLVVIQGSDRGRTLMLQDGINAIELTETDRIRISIVASTEATSELPRITYNSNDRSFEIAQSVNNQPLRLNGAETHGASTIQVGDSIQIGGVMLRFQPFCDATFDWSDLSD